MAVAAVLTASLTAVHGVAAEDFAYDTRIVGVDDEELRETLERVSRLVALEDEPPASLSALRRRAENDVEAFSTVLRSEGYYDHIIRYRLNTSRSPVRVRIDIDPGPPYVLKSFDVILKGDDLDPAMESVARVRERIDLERRSRAKEIVDAEEAVIAELRRSAFPFPGLVDREVVVDHAERSVTVRSTVETGGRARFGQTTVTGISGPLVAYAERRVPWEKEEFYDPDKLESLRSKLASTGLFSKVRVRSAEEVGPDGLLPMEIELERADERSIGVGARYSSSDGAGASGFWEHRNLFGHAERLRLSSDISQLGEEAKLTFRRPDSFSTDQTLVFDASYEVEETEAFDSRKFKSSLGLERPLWTNWTAVGGVGFEIGPVEGSDGVKRDVVLVGLPMALRRDTSNSLLDPTRGTRLELGFTPYFEELGSDLTFFVGRISPTFYLPFDRQRRLVFAGRTAVGAIAGAGRFTIPPDKRFYAGGGGSVRGYAFQHAGPLNEERDPVGGRSLFEAAGELRWRFTDSFAVVPFVDAGNVFEETYPSFADGLFWGAGLGFRYFSPVGPIRLDLATPLNPRSGVDDPVQFYISLGQAF